jgi:hypothetical protein
MGGSSSIGGGLRRGKLQFEAGKRFSFEKQK